MHEALTGLLDTADLALSAVGGVVGEEETDETARLIAHARIRLDYPEDVIVVALAGGTGSGKSSLFNAVTGTDAAGVGELRPTTAEPLAAVPAGRAGAMAGYLDLLDITRRVEHPDPLICLVDLPDTDSVVTAHRHRVEEIMPRIDVMVWVVDPEKYRDAALHHRYLKPLSGYGSQFVFVLNQVDRLGHDDAERVLGDLRIALGEDGFSDPVVLATSLDPGAPSMGVDDVVETLRAMAARRETLYRKLVADLARAAGELERAIGSPIGYRDLMAPVVDEAAGLMVSGDGHGAVDVLSRFCDEVADRIGGGPGEVITALSADIPRLVDEAVAGLPTPSPPSRLPWRRRRPDDGPDRLEEARKRVGRLLAPITGVVTERAQGHALVAELAVGAARLGEATSG